MSQRVVGIVIRFALDRVETLAELSLRGLELTRDEMDLFVQTDARLWFWERAAIAQLH